MRRVLLFLLLLAGTSLATTEVIRDPKSWDFSPLQYADIVVHGTIQSIRDSTISSSDLWMDRPSELPDRQQPIKLVDVSVMDVLRGPLPGPSLRFVLSRQETFDNFRPGWQYLIGAKVHPKLGLYYIKSSSYASYTREDSASWKSRMTSRGQRTFTFAEVRAKIDEMAIERVARDAELVFAGTLVESDTTEFHCADSTSAEQVTLRFVVDELKRGTLDTDSVSVFMLTRGSCLPAWRKHVARRFAVGQTWLCFLQKNQYGWYFFAGANGMFRIANNRLIYDDTVAFWYTKEYVEELVKGRK